MYPKADPIANDETAFMERVTTTIIDTQDRIPISTSHTNTTWIFSELQTKFNTATSMDSLKQV
jgi:hypothetical protein